MLFPKDVRCNIVSTMSRAIFVELQPENRVCCSSETELEMLKLRKQYKEIIGKIWWSKCEK